MNVLIIGGCGFIGLHLANKILDDGHSVVLLDTYRDTSIDKELRETLDRSNIGFIQNAATDGSLPTELGVDFTHIVHLAAILGVQNVLENAFSVLDLNVALTCNALKIGRAQKNLKQFVFASTSERQGVSKYLHQKFLKLLFLISQVPEQLTCCRSYMAKL